MASVGASARPEPQRPVATGLHLQHAERSSASVFWCSGDAEVSTEPETSPDDAGDDDSVIDEEEPESAADKSASIATYCEANAANDAAFENMNPADPESVRNLVLKSRNGLRDVIP